MAIALNPKNPDVQWRIYYHTGIAPDYYNTFSNLDGTPYEAPIDGVIIILQPTETGERDQVFYADYYFLDDEEKWCGCGEGGLQDRDSNNLPYSAVKNGRWINTERFQAILSVSRADPDFPQTQWSP